MKKIIGIIIILAAVTAIVFTVNKAVFAPAGETATSTPPEAVGEVTSVESVPGTWLPERLLIPEIGVDATVQHVGIKSTGEMANPSNFTDVAWYKHGTVPGLTGSAVVAGHVDNALALNGVFKDLRNLKKGDDVYVVREDGRRLHFKVEELKYYPYDNAPASAIFNAADAKRLNLITCAGIWLKDKKTYTERLVVYARLVE